MSGPIVFPAPQMPNAVRQALDLKADQSFVAENVTPKNANTWHRFFDGKPTQDNGKNLWFKVATFKIEQTWNWLNASLAINTRLYRGSINISFLTKPSSITDVKLSTKGSFISSVFEVRLTSDDVDGNYENTIWLKIAAWDHEAFIAINHLRNRTGYNSDFTIDYRSDYLPFDQIPSGQFVWISKTGLNCENDFAQTDAPIVTTLINGATHGSTPTTYESDALGNILLHLNLAQAPTLNTPFLTLPTALRPKNKIPFLITTASGTGVAVVNATGEVAILSGDLVGIEGFVSYRRAI